MVALLMFDREYLNSNICPALETQLIAFCHFNSVYYPRLQDLNSSPTIWYLLWFRDSASLKLNFFIYTMAIITAPNLPVCCQDLIEIARGIYLA